MPVEGIQSTQVSLQTPISSTPVKENREVASASSSAASREMPEHTASAVTETAESTNLVSGSDEEPSQVSLDAIKKTVNELNKANHNTTVQFGVHEATNRMTIKILDKDTRKVIKEFPAEKSLDLIAKALEIAGILVDEKR